MTDHKTEDNHDFPHLRMIAVVGPTASGKTDLAAFLAARLGGEIISTDSIQIYRYLDIGTSKAPLELRERIPHHLLDIVNPDESFSAARYLEEVSAVTSRLESSGKTAVLCGGAGLYFRALLFGLAAIPPIPPDIRAQVSALMAEKGAPECHGELARLDPQTAAKLHPHDSARIMRALEVFLSHGKSIGTYWEKTPFQTVAPHVLSVGYGWERAELYERINKRVEKMMAAGWVDEVRNILDMGYSPDLKPLRSIGYKEISALLSGKRDTENLTEDIAKRTRHYAKRQITWFKKHPDIIWVDSNQQEKILQKVEFFLKSGN